MASLIQRPRFYEGQVLGAADLTAGLEYARSQEARHQRLVHEWGIADGLALTATPQTGFVTVTLGSGLAIDGSGREVVVPDPVVLDEQQFVRRNVAVADPDAFYPVLIAGSDAAALPPPMSFSCSAAQASRTVESYKLNFGAPGDEQGLDQQAVPPVDQGAGGAPNGARWWILVGFVKWDAAQRKFTDIAVASNGVIRRYVGVRADEVTAQGGTLTLRSRPAGTQKAPLVAIERTSLGGKLVLGIDDGSGDPITKLIAYSDGTIESDTGQLTLRSGPPATVGKPMLRLQETAKGGTLDFGLQDAGGNPSQLMTVDEQGNLTIAGTFSGHIAAADFQSVRVQSGVASDGMILPLPDGVTEAQVQSGAVLLHIFLTPRPIGPEPWDAALVPLLNVGPWIGTPLTASVDAERRLQCQVRWIGFHVPPWVEILSGSCDYLILAVAQPPGGI